MNGVAHRGDIPALSWTQDVTLGNRVLRTSLFIGATAAARTAILFAIVGRVRRTGLPIIDDVLWAGVQLALRPFGGVNETTLPTLAKVGIGALFNGIVWSALGLVVVAFYHRHRRQTATSGIHSPAS